MGPAMPPIRMSPTASQSPPIPMNAAGLPPIRMHRASVRGPYPRPFTPPPLGRCDRCGERVEGPGTSLWAHPLLCQSLCVCCLMSCQFYCGAWASFVCMCVCVCLCVRVCACVSL
jgi:hypothetical protein